MSTDLARLEKTLSPRKPFHRPQLGRALRALRVLLDDPDRTEQAFEVGYALDGDTFTPELQRVLRCESGRRLLREQPSLLDKVSNKDTLRAMPDGSLGRAYLAHLERYDLTAEKLVELRRDTDPLHASRDEVSRWWVERSDLMHDFWHVLSGYGADGRGEAALLWFSLAQRPTRSGALLSFGASVRMLSNVGASWLGEIGRAFWHGMRASRLAALPYEDLLEEPLEAVRRAVRLAPAASATPT